MDEPNTERCVAVAPATGNRSLVASSYVSGVLDGKFEENAFEAGACD